MEAGLPQGTVLTRAKLYPMTSRTSKLALRNKVTFIKSVLQPHLNYASPAAKSHLKKLQAVENIALRTAVDAPWYVKNVDIQRYQLLDNG